MGIPYEWRDSLFLEVREENERKDMNHIRNRRNRYEKLNMKE